MLKPGELRREEFTEEESAGFVKEVRFVCLLVGCLTSQQQASVSQGRICSILRAATLTYKIQIKLSTSPSHSILTPGRPVPALTL